MCNMRQFNITRMIVFSNLCLKVSMKKSRHLQKGKEKSNRDGTPTIETKPRAKGYVYSKFIKKYNITSKSHHVYFVAPFLLFKRNFHSTKCEKFPSFQLWTERKILKATLMGAGEGRNTYND